MVSHGAGKNVGVDDGVVGGRRVDDALEALTLLPADVLPQVVELDAVFGGFVRKVGGDLGEVLLVLAQRLVEHVHLLRRPRRSTRPVLQLGRAQESLRRLDDVPVALEEDVERLLRTVPVVLHCGAGRELQIGVELALREHFHTVAPHQAFLGDRTVLRVLAHRAERWQRRLERASYSHGEVLPLVDFEQIV